MIYCEFFFRKLNLFITFSALAQSKQSVFYTFLWNHKLSKTIGHILRNMKLVYFRIRCFLCSLYQVVAIKVKMFVTRRISRYIIAIWGKLPRMKSIDQSLCLLWLVNTHCSSLFLQELSLIIFVEGYVTFYCPIYLYISLLHFICKLF